MEVFRPARRASTALDLPSCVSILVLMEVFRPVEDSQHPAKYSTKVSILVLMEVFRPGVEVGPICELKRRFNPCSDGSVSTGRPLSFRMCAHTCFNPCSDGSVSTGTSTTYLTIVTSSCFNPCSDGSVSTGRRYGVLFRIVHVSILVLMEVFRPARRAAKALDLPSCVSILVLMEVFRPVSRWRSYRMRRKTVSILVLMEVFRPAGVKRSLRGEVTWSFNPCSDGSVSTGICRPFHPGMCDLVSILVLMEVFRPVFPLPRRHRTAR